MTLSNNERSNVLLYNKCSLFGRQKYFQIWSPCGGRGNIKEAVVVTREKGGCCPHARFLGQVLYKVMGVNMTKQARAHLLRGQRRVMSQIIQEGVIGEMKNTKEALTAEGTNSLRARKTFLRMADTLRVNKSLEW